MSVKKLKTLSVVSVFTILSGIGSVYSDEACDNISSRIDAADFVIQVYDEYSRNLGAMSHTANASLAKKRTLGFEDAIAEAKGYRDHLVELRSKYRRGVNSIKDAKALFIQAYNEQGCP